MKKLLFILSFCLITLASNAQDSKLLGQYTYSKSNDMFESYSFSSDHKFSFYLSGCMGINQGKGTYQLKDNTLILFYDSVGMTKSLNKPKDYNLRVVPTGRIDTLKITSIKKNKINLHSQYYGYVITYKKRKTKPFKLDYQKIAGFWTVYTFKAFTSTNENNIGTFIPQNISWNFHTENQVIIKDKQEQALSYEIKGWTLQVGNLTYLIESISTYKIELVLIDDDSKRIHLRR